MSALQVFATAVLAIMAKQVFAVLLQLVGRLRAKRLSYPEDAKFARGFEAGDPPSVVHAQHMIRNSLENEPLFLILLFTYFLTQMSSFADLQSHDAWVQSASIYMWTFVGARYLHALTFVTRKQPWRTLTYSVGLCATIGLGVQILLHAW